MVRFTLATMTTPDEHDANDRRPRSTLAVWFAIVLVLLPVVYALALGPLVWLNDRGYLGAAAGVLGFLYAPLDWLHQSSPTAKAFLDWYVSLWGHSPN
jgi:hypothetical protein